MEDDHRPTVLRGAGRTGKIEQRQTSKGSKERIPIISFQSAPIILNRRDSELKKGSQVEKVDIFRQVWIDSPRSCPTDLLNCIVASPLQQVLLCNHNSIHQLFSQ